MCSIGEAVGGRRAEMARLSCKDRSTLYLIARDSYDMLENIPFHAAAFEACACSDDWQYSAVCLFMNGEI